MYLNYPENYIQLCKKNIYRDIDSEELIEVEEDINEDEELYEDSVEEVKEKNRSYDYVENNEEYNEDEYIDEEEYIGDEFMERGCVDVKCMCKKMHKEIKGMGEDIMDDMKSLKYKMMKEKASLTNMMKELMVMQKELMVMVGNELKKSCEKEEIKKDICSKEIEDEEEGAKVIIKDKKEKCIKPMVMKEEGDIKKIDKDKFKDIDEEYILKCENKRGERRNHSRNRKSK